MSEERDLAWLRRLRTVSAALAREADLERLFHLIVESAIELTKAERGFLVRLEETPRGVKKRVEMALGFDGDTLSSPASKVSKTVVQRVVDEDREVLTTVDADSDLMEVSSVQARRVLSIACVPMRLRGKTVGVLYVDHRFDMEAFSPSDLPCLNAFADQAALALETAQLLASAAAQPQTNHAPPPPQRLIPDPSSIVRRGSLVGRSEPMAELEEAIDRAARSLTPILVVGEVGSGKTAAAEEVHRRSSRKGSFESLACSDMDERSLRSRLFGYLDLVGVSTDGALVRTSSGTLVLEDVDSLSLQIQKELLSVLKEKQFQPVRSRVPQPLLTRVVVTLSKDPDTLVEQGRLSEELVCFLSLQTIAIPPLRDRREDVPDLFVHFLSSVAPDHGVIAPEILDKLVQYDWPGNLRELKNLCVRLATVGGELSAASLPEEIRLASEVSAPLRTLAEVKRDLVVAALRETKGSRVAAARKLGIPRSTFYRMLNDYGLNQQKEAGGSEPPSS